MNLIWFLAIVLLGVPLCLRLITRNALYAKDRIFLSIYLFFIYFPLLGQGLLGNYLEKINFPNYIFKVFVFAGLLLTLISIIKIVHRDGKTIIPSLYLNLILLSAVVFLSSALITDFIRELITDTEKLSIFLAVIYLIGALLAIGVILLILGAIGAGTNDPDSGREAPKTKIDTDALADNAGDKHTIMYRTDSEVVIDNGWGTKTLKKVDSGKYVVGERYTDDEGNTYADPDNINDI